MARHAPAVGVRAEPFADRPALAARFADETRTLVASRVRVCCWLALLLVPLFAGLDRILHPELVRPFLVIRLALMVNAALVLLALRAPFGRRHTLALSFLTFGQTGLGMVVMTVFNGGASSPYYAGLNLVMLAAAVLMPWEAAYSAALALTLTGGFVVACVRWGGIPDRAVFVADLFFLGSTGVITVVSHIVGSRARRRDFMQRVALEEAGRHRDEFLANITHELRTPLAAIIGFCEMLTDYMPEATSEQRTWLGRIRDNALTLLRLIVQLLDFSKIEAGAMELARERFSLDAIVTKVAGDMRAIAGAHGTEVGVDLAAEPISVIGDPARVEEIITNLASNALKFSRGRPIALRLTRSVLDVEPPWHRIVPEPGPEARGQAYAQVLVADAGEGIQPEDLRRLFVAFQQLDGSSTRRHGGTGLGLTISSRLAAAMHGHIAVRSTPGEGSTFALLVPIAPAALESAANAPAATPPRAAAGR